MSKESEQFISWWQKERPSAEKAAVIDKLCDPHYLPKYAEVVDTFLFKYLEGLSFTDFYAFILRVSPYSIHECFTQEYVQGLGTYLSGRINEIANTTQRQVVVLDPCSGNGRLPYFLTQELDHSSAKDNYVFYASDIGVGHQPKKETPIYDVERLDYQDAVKKYNPDIIVASWIPSTWGDDIDKGTRDEDAGDWARFFRHHPSVMEYVLISRPYWEDYYTMGTNSQRPAGHIDSHIRDGFRAIDHTKLGRYQICEEDVEPKKYGSCSKTVSYIREAPVPTG
jgi:hypothetical protein